MQAGQVVVACELEDDRETLDRLAGQYAAANENKKSPVSLRKGPQSYEDIGLDAYPRLAMPILTGRTDDAEPHDNRFRPNPRCDYVSKSNEAPNERNWESQAMEQPQKEDRMLDR